MIYLLKLDSADLQSAPRYLKSTDFEPLLTVIYDYPLLILEPRERIVEFHIAGELDVKIILSNIINPKFFL